ncbi:hypothetical protein HU200_021729 [Digitaria exilis]|uniref:Uncharacterized protein n=1 Tax=Digitaria exilis TaxID=1010633 RepID=A0A835KDL5_9POAL|nr:hypothetical protein HU200_021729 [Digitaria exilis]
MENITHIFASCPRTEEVWQRLGIQPGMEIHPSLVGRSLGLPTSTHVDAILLIFWHIWKSLECGYLRQAHHVECGCLDTHHS